MKNLILFFSMCALLTVTMVACEQDESQPQPMTENVAENVPTVDGDIDSRTAGGGGSCSADCFLTSCSISCNTGTPSCICVSLMFAECTCQSSAVGKALSLSKPYNETVQAVQNLQNFMTNNGFSNPSELTGAIMDVVDIVNSGNTEGYGNAVANFEHLLSQRPPSEQQLFAQWVQSQQ